MLNKQKGDERPCSKV